MISECVGSVFDTPAQALVNPVNCEGVMGKGLALEFKRRFPDAFADYRRMCLANELTPGRLHAFRCTNGQWIVNFPTKALWRNPSRIEFVELGLPVLARWMEDNAVGSIAIPALGCGLGGLPWSEVRDRIVGALAPLAAKGIEIGIYPPKELVAA